MIYGHTYCTYCTYQVRTQWYTTVHTCTYCTVQYQEALAGRSTDDLYIEHTVLQYKNCTYVPNASPVVHYCLYTVRTVLYQEPLAGRSTDDLCPVYCTYYQNCTYQVRTQWYTTVHTCTYCTYCTKKLLLGGAWMIYRHTVRANCIPSGTLLFIPVLTVPRSSRWEEHG